MNEKPKRGCFLTGWLVLGLIGSFFGMFIIFSNSYMVKVLPEYPKFSTSVLVVSTIASIIQFASTIGIFLWKKVAVYLYAGIALFNFAYSFFMNEISTTTIISGIIGVLLNLWAAYTLMKLFKEMEDSEKEIV
ncbi:hypothetical protein [Hathewaya massiliensis]|uniref:hypothetical protein n=1 Tax=Hathewaya massiliensis TaxID=1964382 RepID=UPI001158A3FE|nr:hypothetical protein [Hathewaya massiliensis]